jgi:hypothetical protein
MARKGQRPYYERFHYDLVALYAGILILLAGVFVFSQYTQGWTWSLGSTSIWALIGWSVLAGGAVIWGASSSFRQKTRKLLAGNYMFEFSHPEPISVTTQHYAVRKEVLQMVLPESFNDDIDRAVQVPSGTDGKGHSVKIELRGPGGVDAYGFHSLQGGQQGYIIFRGTSQLVQMGSNWWCPHTLEAVDHTKVAPEILTTLKNTQDNFVENSTPIFEPGPLDGGVEKWLSISPSAQSAVLRVIGFDGLADKFVTRLENLLLSSKNGEKLKEAWKTDAKTAIRLAFSQWLERQQPLEVAMGFGEAGIDYWRSYALSLRSELTLAEARLDLKSDTIYTHERESNQRARRGARVLNAPPTSGPAFDVAGRRPGDTGD